MCLHSMYFCIMLLDGNATSGPGSYLRFYVITNKQMALLIDRDNHCLCTPKMLMVRLHASIYRLSYTPISNTTMINIDAIATGKRKAVLPMLGEPCGVLSPSSCTGKCLTEWKSLFFDGDPNQHRSSFPALSDSVCYPSSSFGLQTVVTDRTLLSYIPNNYDLMVSKSNFSVFLS